MQTRALNFITAVAKIYLMFSPIALLWHSETLCYLARGSLAWRRSKIVIKKPHPSGPTKNSLLTRTVLLLNQCITAYIYIYIHIYVYICRYTVYIYTHLLLMRARAGSEKSVQSTLYHIRWHKYGMHACMRSQFVGAFLSRRPFRRFCVSKVHQAKNNSHYLTVIMMVCQ